MIDNGRNFYPDEYKPLSFREITQQSAKVYPLGNFCIDAATPEDAFRPIFIYKERVFPLADEEEVSKQYFEASSLAGQYLFKDQIGKLRQQNVERNFIYQS